MNDVTEENTTRLDWRGWNKWTEDNTWMTGLEQIAANRYQDKEISANMHKTTMERIKLDIPATLGAYKADKARNKEVQHENEGIAHWPRMESVYTSFLDVSDIASERATELEDVKSEISVCSTKVYKDLETITNQPSPE